MRPLQYSIVLSFLLLLTLSCGDESPDAKAWGQFESTEIIISAQTAGTIINMAVQRGDELKQGDAIAVVDTTQLSLQFDEILARENALQARKTQIGAEKMALEAQLNLALKTQKRLQDMKNARASTQQQVDEAEGQVSVLEARISAIEPAIAQVSAEMQSLQIKKLQLEDQLQRCFLISPINATILETFVEESEFVAPGKPIVKLANISTMELLVYVSGSQLAETKIGASTTVQFDGADGAFVSREGTITWIASRAEFTPKTIQTREDRITQVYGVRIAVPNDDGALKIGMPGEWIQ